MEENLVKPMAYAPKVTSISGVNRRHDLVLSTFWKNNGVYYWAQ